MTTNEIALSHPVDRVFSDERAVVQVKNALNYEFIRGPVIGYDSFLAAVKEDVAADRLKGRQDTLWDAFRTNPESAIAALSRAAQCKLIPGSSYGQFYLIPRKKHGRLEVTGQLGYRGLCTMSTRHERVHSVEAFLVYEGEEFDCDLASGHIHHKWNPSVKREDKDIIAGYAKVVITEAVSQHPIVGSPIIWPMDRAAILKRRDASDAYRYAEKGRKDSPWHIWFPEMARKTLLIGVLAHGSVPQDMGVGGVLASEAQDDLVPAQAKLKLPTREAEVREKLGMSRPEPFGLAEEAVAAIQQARSIAELEALADRWQHFQGSDAETIATAYEDREKEIQP